MAAKKKKATGGFDSSASAPWTPFVQPTKPPPGSYDPSLDATERAAQRGYGNVQDDQVLADARDREDLGTQLGALQTALDQAMGGYDSAREHATADMSTARNRLGAQYETGKTALDQALARSNQDYGTATQAVGRNYTNLGNAQGGAAAAAGVSGGGSLAASLRARMANTAIDQGGLDVSHARQGQDIATSRTALDTGFAQSTEDIQRQYDRQREAIQQGVAGAQGGYGQQKSALEVALERAVADRGTQVQRAGIELPQFEAATAASRWAQAAQQGYATPTRGQPGGPAVNEFHNAQGAYKLVMKGGKRFHLLPSGQMVPA